MRPRPDAQNDALSHYSPADEEQAVNEERARRPKELFRRLAEEPRNALIRDKIIEIAHKFDDLSG